MSKFLPNPQILEYFKRLHESKYITYSRETSTNNLCVAVIEKDLLGVKQILDETSELNFTENLDGDTALHFAACIENNRCIIRELVNRGASINYKDCLQETPLHKAVAKGRAENVEELLKLGADANALNHMNRSPLHYSFITLWEPNRVANAKCAKLLLENGADINLVDLEGCTVLQAALKIESETHTIPHILQRKNVQIYIQYLALKYILGTSIRNLENFLMYCLSTLYNEIIDSEAVRIFNDYLEQVLKMTTSFLDYNLSVFDLLVDKYFYSKAYFIPPHYCKILTVKYPCYKNMLWKLSDRDCLLQNLNQLWLVLNKPDGNVIAINGHVLTDIGKYLSQRDLYNFLQACLYFN